MYTLNSMILYSSIISTPVSMTKNQYPPNSGHDSWLVYEVALRATSRTRLRTRDQYTSSTLIGGKCGASPSWLHTMLEAPTE